MAAEQLQIQVQANVSNAISGLNDLNKSLATTNTAAVKTGTTGMQALTKGTGQASTAITNFSRVAQDAPFGLIGIANNIDPLIQSFVQLRKETGSGKAALAALGSSLTGGGGLILAVSLVTSAVQFAQIGFDRWFKSTKDTKKETESLSDTISNVTQNLSKEIAQVTKLVELIKSENTSRKLKKEAIDELIKVAPEYFDNLNKENIAIDKLDIAYKRYINTIQTRVRATVLEKQLADIIAQEQEINTLRTVRAKDPLGLKNLLSQNALRKVETAELKTQNTENSKLLNISNQKTIILNELVKLQQEINNLDGQNKSAEKTKKSIDLLKEYRLELKAISWNEVNRGIDGTIERLNLAESTLQSFLKQGVEPTRKEFVFITQEVEKFRAAYARVLASGRIELSIPKIEDEEVNKFAQSLQKLDTFKDAPGFVLESLSKGLIKANEGAVKLGETFKAAEILRKNSEKNLKELTATIQGYVNPVIDNLFSALEQGEDPFKALIQSVKQLVFELGKAVVKSLALKAIQSILAPQSTALPLPGFQPGNIRFDQLRFAFFR